MRTDPIQDCTYKKKKRLYLSLISTNIWLSEYTLDNLTLNEGNMYLNITFSSSILKTIYVRLQ